MSIVSQYDRLTYVGTSNVPRRLVARKYMLYMIDICMIMLSRIVFHPFESGEIYYKIGM